MQATDVKNFIILGAPGSGKDTQVKKLQEHFNLELISTGDISRKLGVKDQKIKKIIESGGLVPDTIIFRELKAKIKELSKEKGFILDGFPRTLKQASELEKLLFRMGKKIDKVIYLNVPEEELVVRLSRRYVCPKCGYISISQEKICPICGAKMVKRIDDNPSVAAERISLYLERTIPVVGYYRSRGDLVEINGDQPVSDVAKDILGAIEV